MYCYAARCLPSPKLPAGSIRVLILSLFLSCATAHAQGTLLSGGGGSGEEISLENCRKINDRESQFGPAVYGDRLVYVSRNRRGNVNPTNNKPYFGLFQAERTPDGQPQRGKTFSVALSSNYNEGPVSFSNEDRVIYFTRTQLDEGTTLEDLTGRANLGIYSAFRAEYDWAAIRSLPFNNVDFSNQHPSVTADARRIFFSSNRPGGYGGLDLYFSDYRDGRWGPAINLGPDVNTEGDEAFPFIHGSGRLFFASTGHGGRGRYDLYMIDIGSRRWGKLYRLPSPINSDHDDISLVLNQDATMGYLSSNRPGGEGEDDIYLLRLRNGLNSLQGNASDGETLTIYDGSTSRRVANAEVWLDELDDQGRRPAVNYSFELRPPVDATTAPTIAPVPKPLGELSGVPLRSANDGTLRLQLVVGKTYEVNVYHPDFAPQRFRFAYDEAGPSRPLELTLQPSNCRLVSGRVTNARGIGMEEVAVQFRPQGCGVQPITTTTDLAGFYEACVPKGCTYLISTGKAGYVSTGSVISVTQLQQYDHPRLELVVESQGNMDQRQPAASGAILPLPGLAFRGDGTTLLPGRKHDLELVREFLQLRPDLKVSILGHVGGSGNGRDLQARSSSRVEAIRQALLALGAPAERLTAVGFGNLYPLKPCIPCSEEEVELNSRIEARVE